MNIDFKSKLKEAVSFIICLVVLLAIARYTGFLQGFAPEDFLEAYQNTVLTLNKNTKATGNRERILSTGNETSRKSSSYKDYRLRTIPQTVIDGAYESGTWTNIFDADKKAVFYVYDPTGNDRKLSPDFHERLSRYLSYKENAPYYTLFAYTSAGFKNVKTGAIGPSKICDSLEECNQQRKAASDYSYMAEFFKQCAKTACIINPYNNKYIILKERNSGAAVKVLNDLRKW